MFTRRDSLLDPENKLAIQTKEFWDDTALLEEEQRVFDICQGCRLCWNFCPSFPALFERTDEVDGDLKRLSRADFRPVEDLCYQCKLCYVRCPYTPPHRFDLDFPRLLMRAKFVNAKADGVKLQEKILASTDLMGTLGGLVAPIVNTGATIKPLRIITEKVIGIHRDAALPKFHRNSFAKIFNSRYQNMDLEGKSVGKVAFFPTCSINYNDPSVGIACVEVLRKNDCEVTVPPQECCGMPFLDSGDLKSSLKKIGKNVANLYALVEKGYDILIPSPTCSYTIKYEYPKLLETEQSDVLSKHTFDISEYLWKLKTRGVLNTEFINPSFGTKIQKVAYHASCHLRAQFMGNKGADLIGLIPGVKVEQMEFCSGHDGTWGVKKNTYPMSLQIGNKLFRSLEGSKADLFVTDCPLSSIQIEHVTGQRPVHPVQVLDQAYRALV